MSVVSLVGLARRVITGCCSLRSGKNRSSLFTLFCGICSLTYLREQVAGRSIIGHWSNGREDHEDEERLIRAGLSYKAAFFAWHTESRAVVRVVVCNMLSDLKEIDLIINTFRPLKKLKKR